MAATAGPGLYEFLIESELQQYYSLLRNDLKVQNVSQIKYVTDEDLQQIGMSKPEIRRLKKFFQKYYPQNYFYKFKKIILPKKQEQTSMSSMLPDEHSEKTAIKVPNKHIIPPGAIIVNKELGTGEFGVVQQGVWTNDSDRIQVAIKCLSRERMQNNPIDFLKEAAIMHSIDHEHIVRLYGVVLDTSSLMLEAAIMHSIDHEHIVRLYGVVLDTSSLMLVTELAPLRSLLECLKEPSLRASFPVLSLCDFAVQICDGMQYLETKRLIHRDLAARNILVFSKNKVKISDFGLSRALGVGKDYYQTNFNVNLKLPIAWCAPESISFLRFTSASDVWAYGVTLWEMFSYGFQPWAALTGQQILEAIDEPNFQRLEQPESCPKEYYNIMLKCWQHDATKRPKFSQLITVLPECKPEQVQAIQEYTEDPMKLKRDQLCYRVGDVITVLDKSPVPSISCWKGALNNGKTGLFNPAHTVAYLGSNLPSNKPSELVRGDGKNLYSSRRRLKPDMISCPQGDMRHTGHVGVDGAFFGDIAFLGSKYTHLPKQVVTPYKPHEDTDHISDRAPLLKVRELDAGKSVLWTDDTDGKRYSQLTNGAAAGMKSNHKHLTLDHEYHEISDEENLVDSPRSEKSFDFGPSLMDEMDEMFRSLGTPTRLPPPPSPPPSSPLEETINVRNEIREMTTKVSGKKKQAMVKPISAADERTLDTAIALANELAFRSMNNFDNGITPPESPHTPNTPNKRKFSFKFPNPINRHGSPKTDRRTFSEEAASIPDIQSSLSEEAKEVYNSLVEQPAVTHPSTSPQETNPLRMLRSGAFPVVRPRTRGNKHNAVEIRPSASDIRNNMPPPFSSLPATVSMVGTYPRDNQTRSAYIGNSTLSTGEEMLHSTSLEDVRLEQRRHSTNSEESNPIPLPPRDRSKTVPSEKPRHRRKHPLIIPGSGILAKMVEVAENPPLYENSTLRKIHQKDDEETPPSHRSSLGDSFEDQIACELEALDDIPDQSQDESQTAAMMRHDDHVSCEDLLEFACDTPNANRTRGKARGIDSDEVRIMGKVLGSEVPTECCVIALNVCEWDVHKAIKVARLYNLLQSTVDPNEQVDLGCCNTALETCGWDVARAASWLLAQEQGDTTQV